MIVWPAIVKYAGSDELAYVASEQDWTGDPHLSRYRYETGDKLIDSGGRVYRLPYRGGRTIAKPAGEVTTEAVVDLVRAHAAQTGSCCIAKFGAVTVAEAIAIAGALQ